MAKRKKAHKGKKKRGKKGHIPIDILKKRLIRLSNVIRTRTS